MTRPIPCVPPVTRKVFPAPAGTAKGPEAVQRISERIGGGAIRWNGLLLDERAVHGWASLVGACMSGGSF